MGVKPLNDSERIDLAKAYVALSNSHRLAFIRPLFAQDATYHSAYVGEFKGRQAIGAMMADFFARFPDVRWQAEVYRSTGPESVGFEFLLTATESLTGNRIERRGEEYIEFTQGGFISRLEVK